MLTIIFYSLLAVTLGALYHAVVVEPKLRRLAEEELNHEHNTQ